MKTLMRAALALALGVVAVQYARPAGAAEVKLKAATFLPVNQPFVVPCKRFIDKVNADGAGVVQIRLVGGPEAVGGFQQPNAVKTGVLDMSCVPGTYYKGQFLEVEAMQLATKTFAEQRASGGWAYLNQLHQERMSVYYLAAYGDGVPFHLYLTKKPTRLKAEGLPDLTGFKLRTAPVYEEFFRFLGATTATIEGAEVRTALERGLVDGLGWPVLGLHFFGWEKHIKFRVNPGFYHTAIPIILNLAKWKSLDEAQRDLLTKTGIWMEAESAKWMAEMRDTDYQKQDADGIQHVEFGPGFAKKATDIYWEVISKPNPKVAGRLRELLTD